MIRIIRNNTLVSKFNYRQCCYILSLISLVSFAVQAGPFPKGIHPALNETNSDWDNELQILTIRKNVNFSSISTYVADEVMDDFYWNIPQTIEKVVIGKNVTVVGHFRFTGDQTITGEDRNSSIIFGTNTKAWARGYNQVEDLGTQCARNGKAAAVAGDDRVHDCEKWLYGAISVLPEAPKDVTYKVTNLTIENPRTYAITAINHRLLIDSVNILNTRPKPDYQSNSDGIGGGKGTSISNTYIDTWDDSIKLYRDNTSVTNVTIIHNTNGSPFQLGWGNKSTTHHKLEDIKVIQGDNKGNLPFNLALFANSGGKIDATVELKNFAAIYQEKTQLRKCANNQSLPLVYLAHDQSSLTLVNAPESNLILHADHLFCGKGKLNFSVNNQQIKSGVVSIGTAEYITGCKECL